MKKRFLSNRGVTVIEMMIGVAIVGVVASMAVPRFQAAADRMEFRAITRDVISMVRYARSEAISKKAPYGVYFDSHALTATFFLDQGTIPEVFEPYADSILKVDSLGDRHGAYLDWVGTTLNNDAVVFSPNGSASSGGTINTQLTSDYIYGSARITILQSTGRITHESAIYSIFDIETS